MRRKPPSIEKAVVGQAKAVDLNMSRTAEAAAVDSTRLERNRRWREENRAALDAYAREIDREGLRLSRFRSF
jgi:antitoxin CcdA